MSDHIPRSKCSLAILDLVSQIHLQVMVRHQMVDCRGKIGCIVGTCVLDEEPVVGKEIAIDFAEALRSPVMQRHEVVHQWHEGDDGFSTKKCSHHVHDQLRPARREEDAVIDRDGLQMRRVFQPIVSVFPRRALVQKSEDERKDGVPPEINLTHF
ncbi:hypothetical protein [Rhizobium rhizophilum]|uniref:Uncharacterized protein n=1 Tax=Rhizobium rhizophilum TaxID=1850373 RepID=A0ABY2QXH8_9HYPH|nr:hypothetical protein [Rhizobium rhizophilum]THV15765.1 hypothetical protein E9677_10520 [Rhizobium rhizophilum]